MSLAVSTYSVSRFRLYGKYTFSNSTAPPPTYQGDWMPHVTDSVKGNISPAVIYFEVWYAYDAHDLILPKLLIFKAAFYITTFDNQLDH